MPTDVIPGLGGALQPLVAAVVEGVDAAAPDAVYLGMGVASRRTVATGHLPLDALAMVLVADSERFSRGARQVVHLIADDHALVNAFAESGAVRRAADTLEAELRAAVETLRLPAYRIIRASTISDALHASLLGESLCRCADHYAARQAADVEWARQRFGATVKIGWTTDARPSVPVTGYDERYFDGIYRTLFGLSVTAVYTHPGRRLDPASPRTSPYTHEPGERRLLLTSSLADAVEHCSSRSMRRHLRPLVAAVARRLGLSCTEDLPATLARVLQALGSNLSTYRKEFDHAV